MERPFEAYRGDEPYVFVCYAHEDEALVYPEITWLHERGVNVWYDEGISPGEEWSEELGRAIDGAERFLYLVSPRSVASRHCRNELNFAQNHNKAILSVHLEETELPSGVELVLGASQAIVKPDFTESDYRARLLRSLGQSTESPRMRETERRPTKVFARASRVPWRLAGLLLLTVAVPAAFWFFERSPEQPGKATYVPDRSLAVLRLTVVGGDPIAATYAETWTEELRTAVAGYQELRTVAVLDEGAASEVDTSYVLGGNVQRLGDSLHLRARLTRTDDRDTVWTQTFEHPVSAGASEAPELASVVGRFVRKQIVVDQECEPVRRTTRSQEAADAYCASVAESYGVAMGGESDTSLALSQALRAVALDHEIADAHVFVGLNYMWLGESGQMDWREAAREARKSLDRSLALAPKKPRTFGLKGRIEMLEMNYPAAEADFRESIARDPLLPRVGPIHGRLAMLAYAQGRLDEALEHIRRALRIDDSNAVSYLLLGVLLTSTSEYREAIQAADMGLDLVDSGGIRILLFTIKIEAHNALGEGSRANEILDDALAAAGSELKPMLAGTLASLGRREEARKLLAGLERLEQPPTALMVETYALLSDDRAFDWIHSAIDRHIDSVVYGLRADPAYSVLRNDPRWREVMSHLEAEEAKGRAGKNRQS